MPHAAITDRVFPHAYSYQDGYMHPGDAPGLGVDIDEVLAATFPYERAYLPVLSNDDTTTTRRIRVNYPPGLPRICRRLVVASSSFQRSGAVGPCIRSVEEACGWGMQLQCPAHGIPSQQIQATT